jgi:hypothetical protein
MTSMSLQERIERLEAIFEIQNLMGSYSWHRGEQSDLFAKRDDVSLSIGPWGMYKGHDGIRKFFAREMEPPPKGGPNPNGFMSEHNMCTPVIEVAEDGKTARGVWTSPGFSSMRNIVTDKPEANWDWFRYACDFIKEDGNWKIWHLFNFTVFQTKYEKSFAEVNGPQDIPKTVAVPTEAIGAIANAPNPYPNFYSYDPNKLACKIPAAPLPYKTYDPNEDWIDPDSPKYKRR